jgi:hypothetical protein
MLRFLPLLVLLTSCGPKMLILRGSSNDFLKRKATAVAFLQPPEVIQGALDGLMFQIGMKPTSTQAGEKGSKVVIYKGPRAVPPELAAYGITLGSWYAARFGPPQEGGTGTEVVLMGKPMVGMIELCSEHDKLLQDIQYQCIDTQVPIDWIGKNHVSGRDETSMVTWALTQLYEKLNGAPGAPKKL